jgi:uncharacterized RDD family membrane protein YckC
MISKRIFSFLIDMMLYVLIYGIIITYCNLVLKERGLLFSALMSIPATFWLCKDCIRGQSIGKRKMRIKIVNSCNNDVSPFVSVIRNFSLIIWPIDFIYYLLSESRICDRIFKTKVVEARQQQKQQSRKGYLTILIVWLIIIFVLWGIYSSNPLIRLLYI